MAKFGLEHLAVAPITAEATNTITYGTGSVAEHARRANITYNWVEGKINGDNQMAEYIKILQDADVEMATTELPPEVAALLGLEKVKTPATTGDTATPAVYTMKSEATDNLDLGESTISGKAWPVNLDASGEAQVRDFSEFATEAAAIAWVNAKAGIS